MNKATLKLDFHKGLDEDFKGFLITDLASYLLALPGESRILSLVRLPDSVVGAHFEVLISNPMLKDGSEITLKPMTRDIAFVDGKLVEFNRFEGLDYKTADDRLQITTLGPVA